METTDTAIEILDTMFGYLGFVAMIDADTSADTGEPSLQVLTEDSELLIGHHGERLDDIQYLVNRLVQARHPDAPRVHVDIDHYRASQEHRLIEEAEQAAERVLGGAEEEVKLEPMNSYHRRIVHNHFKGHPDLKTWSPSDSARLKRIVISRRRAD